jgi:hypothetical protein
MDRHRGPIAPRIEALSEELRALPRHLWDQRLWEACDAFIKEAARQGHSPQRRRATVRKPREASSRPA